MSIPNLIIHRSVWKKLMKTLNRRGGGVRETGAFLLGKKDSKVISSFLCYNDLDPHALDSGIIIFNGDGYIPLWRHCSDHGLKVLADVHTHPDQWTGQSASDQHYPMIAQPGHIAFIVPYYATVPGQELEGVGIHEFLGNQQWRAWGEKSGAIQFKNKSNETRH
jgi:proteasome lid subunit RPN8/RPN11